MLTAALLSGRGILKAQAAFNKANAAAAAALNAYAAEVDRQAHEEDNTP